MQTGADSTSTVLGLSKETTMNPSLKPTEELVRELPALVPIARAAKFLNVSTRTLRRWSARGRLKVMRTSPGGSGRVLIRRDELARLLRIMSGELS